MSSQSRVGAIDILKGIIIIFILFISVFYLKSYPVWPGDKDTPEVAGMLAGVLFPALIFLIGMTIPFSITKRINDGLSVYEIVRFIFGRAVILITVGVLMVNTTRVEPELTGIGKNIWSIILFVAFFIVWNRYSENESNFFTVSGLRLAGLAALVFLVFRFRSGTLENNGSLIPGWWEFPGLAGWGYLVASLTYLAFRNSLTGTISIWALFLGLNVLAWLNLSAFLDPVRPYFGVILDGYIPVIILSGQITGLLIKKFPRNELRKTSIILLLSGFMMVAVGVLIYMYRFREGIFGNPAWTLISCGITTILFLLFLRLDEGLKLTNPAVFIKPAGENMFTIYILQFLLFNIAWLTGADIFFFLKPGAVFLNVAGSVVWTILVLVITSLLLRFNIRLKF